MRTGAVITLLALVLAGGIIAQTSFGSSVYVREKVSLQRGGIVSEFIPADNHVRGHVSGEMSFSVYVVPPDPRRFGDFDLDHPLMGWENITYVELDFNTTDDVYLVVVNGGASQVVEIAFRAVPISP